MGALSRVSEADVPSQYVVVVTVAAVACLNATTVAHAPLRLALAVLEATGIPVHTHLNIIVNINFKFEIHKQLKPLT